MYKPTLGFVGAGKVGHTLARLWYAQDYTIGAVYSRMKEDALALANPVNAEVLESPLSVVSAVDLTLITVPDDAISAVVESIRKSWGSTFERGKKGIIHTSGVHGREILSADLSPLGLMTGSLHPIFPFADVETAVAHLPGAAFGVEADADELQAWLEGLVNALDGLVLRIPYGEKAVYHSALVFASNYVVTLYAIAERLLIDLGADQTAVDQALNALLAGTRDNLQQRGIPAALTGPLVRGDTRTIALHLDALEKIDSRLADAYRQLAQLSLPMVSARGIDIDALEYLLNRKENHASDDS